MHVVLLNWNGGENDPFTTFNMALAKCFEACGKCTRTVQVNDGNVLNQILELKLEGIEFVLTLQGIGSNLTIGREGRSFWDTMQVPIICVHGDHPCHMPDNHALESRFSAHLYWISEFAHYSSRHFRRRTAAAAIDAPLSLLGQDERLGPPAGDFFVFAKNITHPSEMEAQWMCKLDGRLRALHLSVAETLRSLLAREALVDFHKIIDDFILHEGPEEFGPNAQSDVYHRIHSQLDFYVRNLKSVAVIDALKDLPLHIYGRGWERQAKAGNKHHRFFSGKSMADSQSLYYSRYGIVDVTPAATGLHDRTLRAMRNETLFVSSAYLPDFLPEMERYQPLFYKFCGNDLREKCEAVIANPDGRAELARDFSRHYQLRVPQSEFVWKVDSIARSMRSF